MYDSNFSGDRLMWPLFIVLIFTLGVVFLTFVATSRTWISLSLVALTMTITIFHHLVSCVSCNTPGFHFQKSIGNVLHMQVQKTMCDTSSSTNSDVFLFLHGLLASGRFWKNTVKHLLKKCESSCVCLTPDLLGFGKSPYPSSKARYTCDAMVQSVLARLRLYNTSSGNNKGNVRRLHIVGHSLGAVIATEIAASLSKKELCGFKLVSLTCISMPFFSSEAEARKEIRRCTPVQNYFLEWPISTYILCSIFCQQRWLWRLPLRAIVFLTGSFIPALSLSSEIVDDFFLHSSRYCMEQCVVGHTLHYAAQKLKKHKLAVSVLHGSIDGSVNVSHGREFAELVGGAFIEVDGIGHLCGSDKGAGLEELCEVLLLQMSRRHSVCTKETYIGCINTE